MAISFVGVGAQTTMYTGVITAPWPTSYTPVIGDLSIFISIGRPAVSGSEIPDAPSGYTYLGTVYFSSAFQICVWYKVLDGTESAPNIDIPVSSSYYGSAYGISVQTAVYRGVDQTTPFDTSYTTSTSAGGQSTYVPASITTVTDKAWCLSIVGTTDDNQLALTSPAGFTARMSGAAYDTNIWGDYSLGLADYEKSTAGLVSMPTWAQGLNSPDGWYTLTAVLRPSPELIHNGYWGILTSVV